MHLETYLCSVINRDVVVVLSKHNNFQKTTQKYNPFQKIICNNYVC
jgi:hypothetical protein